MGTLNSKILNRKILMWYKVKELSAEKLCVSQISKKLNLHRSTIKRYLGMNEEEFLSSNSYKRVFNYKLDDYEKFIHSRLETHPYLSSAQIHDRLKEFYNDFPNINPKTVYNYVQRIRCKYNIPKSEEDLTRRYDKIPDSPFGKYAQVDFGERYLQDDNGKYIKVYFFAMVFCRSRCKFTYFQQTPFTTKTTIYAHELAFEYFGGIPHRIIYDQDKVLIHSENLGDYILTSAFNSFVNQNGFKVSFCRKSDPESKGKVENVVKYVKNNFLKGRTFKNITILNQEGKSWLSRTGNGKRHATTQDIPAEAFKQEIPHLLPYLGTPTIEEEKMHEYHVKKDNTINFRSNYYSLPTGTYQGVGTTVFIEIVDNVINIYNKESGKTITSHTLCIERGKHIVNKSHKQDRSIGIDKLEDKILGYLGKNDLLRSYLENLHHKNPKYYRDNLNYLINHMKEYNPKLLNESIQLCLERSVYNARNIIEVASSKSRIESNLSTEVYHNTSITSEIIYADIIPEKSNIQTYNELFK